MAVLLLLSRSLQSPALDSNRDSNSLVVYLVRTPEIPPGIHHTGWVGVVWA